MKKVLFSIVFLLLVSSFALADIARPDEPRKPRVVSQSDVRLRINVRSEATEPTLTIKRSALKQLRAAIDEAEADENYAEKTVPVSSIARSQTIIGGIFFSLAFIVGGVWMFRTKGKSSKIITGFLVIVFIGAGATLVFANAVPPHLVSLTSRIFAKDTKAYGFATGKAKLRIIDDRTASGYDVIFDIPRGEGDPDLK